MRPKFITFDCYGTLTRFQMGELAAEIYADRVPGELMPQFVRDFAAYRLDEVLGAWQPYAEVIRCAIERTCRKHGVAFVEADARRLYDAIPGWGPHADVPEGLAIVARHFPLVGLSNASNAQIQLNVAQYGAPFHAVFTAEQAQAYKPRFRPFEYMMEQLGARPEELLHVSASFRYDLMTAHDLGIRDLVWVNRGREPANPYFRAHDVPGIDGLAALLGL